MARVNWRSWSAWLGVLLAVQLVVLWGGLWLSTTSSGTGGARFGPVAAGTVSGVGVITFLAFLIIPRLMRDDKSSPTNDEVRTAITVAFVVVNFTLLAVTVFSKVNVESDAVRSLLTNFSTLTASVVAFYFTASAATQIANIKARSNADTTAGRDSEPGAGAEEANSGMGRGRPSGS